MRPAVAVTGRGILTSNAASASEYAQALRSVRCGLGPLTALDPAPYYCKRAGQVRRLDGGDDASSRTGPPQGRVFRLLHGVVDQAVGEAGPSWLHDHADSTGLIIGTTCGSSSAKERLLASGYPGRATRSDTEDELLDEVPFDSLSIPIAEHYGLGGPTAITSVSCTSGGSALGVALAWMDAGDAKAMIAAACEAIGTASFAGFTAVGAMTRETCRPFDRDRDGMVIGEGAAALVLEPMDRARERGARVYAEILGFGCCNDAHHSVMPHPRGEGLAASVWQALTVAGLNPKDVDLICAHGTATALNDAMEQAAYRSVFGDHLRDIPVMAIKPLVGHTLGAAGLVELMATICALDGGFVPPILGHRSADDDCRLWLVREKALQRDLRYAVCCNSAFAGNNTAVVVGRSVQTDSRE